VVTMLNMVLVLWRGLRRWRRSLLLEKLLDLPQVLVKLLLLMLLLLLLLVVDVWVEHPAGLLVALLSWTQHNTTVRLAEMQKGPISGFCQKEI